MVQDHEQALIAAIARLADASDFVSGNKLEQAFVYSKFLMTFHIIFEPENDL